MSQVLPSEAIARLHSQLQQRGFELPVSEPVQKIFGPATQQAVQLFQQQHGLAATGVVDDSTAAKLDEATRSSPTPASTPNSVTETKAIQPQAYFPNSVQVNLVFDNGLPATGLTVYINSVGFGPKPPIYQGTALPQSIGSTYVLLYNPTTAPLNLQVTVLDSAQHEVTISKTKYNAGTQETFNLVVPASISPFAAEYERLSQDMTKSTGGLANLAGAQERPERQDLSLLNQTTNWDARPLAVL